MPGKRCCIKNKVMYFYVYSIYWSSDAFHLKFLPSTLVRRMNLLTIHFGINDRSYFPLDWNLNNTRNSCCSHLSHFKTDTATSTETMHLNSSVEPNASAIIKLANPRKANSPTNPTTGQKTRLPAKRILILILIENRCSAGLFKRRKIVSYL